MVGSSIASTVHRLAMDSMTRVQFLTGTEISFTIRFKLTPGPTKPPIQRVVMGYGETVVGYQTYSILKCANGNSCCGGKVKMVIFVTCHCVPCVTELV
jgi:hypothetical protein